MNITARNPWRSRLFLADVFNDQFDGVWMDTFFTEIHQLVQMTQAIVNLKRWREYHVKDPAHRILSWRDPTGWTKPRGRPHASWLRQVESYRRDMGMTGLASAWAMARRRPNDGRTNFHRPTYHCVKFQFFSAVLYSGGVGQQYRTRNLNSVTHDFSDHIGEILPVPAYPLYESSTAFSN